MVTELSRTTTMCGEDAVRVQKVLEGREHQEAQIGCRPAAHAGVPDLQHFAEFMVLLKRMSTPPTRSADPEGGQERRDLGLKVLMSMAVFPSQATLPRGLGHSSPITVSPTHQ